MGEQQIADGFRQAVRHLRALHKVKAITLPRDEFESVYYAVMITSIHQCDSNSKDSFYLYGVKVMSE